MKCDSFEHDCYNLYTIKTDKFNTTRIEIIFKLKCTKENITYSALLFDVLMDSNKLYKTNKELLRALEELYDALMYASITRVGELLIISTVIEVLNCNFLKPLTKRAIDILFTCIFEPNLVNSSFSYKLVEKVKRRMSDDIKSISEDAKQSSILNALRLLDEESPRCLSISGDLETLNNITNDSLYEFYKMVLNDAEKDIYILGDIDPKEMDKYVFENNKFNSITERTITPFLDEIKTKIIKKHEVTDDTQNNYVLIYALKNLTEFEREYVMTVFNSIWGSGSLESRLYRELREKRGLVYNVNAYYQKYDKCLIVHTACNPSNIKELSRVIKNSLKEIIRKCVSEEELKSSKRLIISSLALIKDNPTRIIDSFLFRNMRLLKDEKERRDLFNKVTKEDISRVAKKLSLVVVYSMGAKDEKTEN